MMTLSVKQLLERGIINYQPQLVWQHRDILRDLGIITDDDDYLLNFYHPRSFLGPFTQWIHDRSGHIRHFLPIHNYLRPLPKYDELYKYRDANKTFETIVHWRAKDLLNKKKPINILWSGGIDSTCIIMAFIANTEIHERKNIKVIGTYDSIVESGPIFDRYIKNSGLQCHINPRVNRPHLFSKILHIEPHEIFVDGHTADQLYGKQQFFAPQWRPDLLDKDWLDVLRIIHEPKEAQKIFNFLRPAVEATDIPTDSYREFLWWYKMNFAMHQQSYASITLLSYKQAESYRFFDWDPFVQWAMVHGPGIIEQQPDKMPQRMFLYKITGNSEYSFLKKRYRSTGSNFYSRWMLSDSTHHEVFVSNIKQMHRELNGDK